MKNVQDVNCTTSFLVVSVWIEVMISSWLFLWRTCFRHVLVSLHKRTAKHMCVTNMTGLLIACFVEIFTSLCTAAPLLKKFLKRGAAVHRLDLCLTLMFSGLLQKDLFKGK